MITKAVILMVLIFVCVPAFAEEESRPPVPMEFVDLERYVGLWYEIAKIPNRFQKQCVKGTTARYSIRDDGKIDVINRCVTEDGEVDEAEGIAKVQNKESNAELKVSFFSLLGLRPFWGDYWIIGLGDDYEYSIVGTADRKYGWVLSRTPEIAADTLEDIYEQLRTQGYDPKAFELSPQ